ncbi:MAG: GldG family protein [Pseudomonadota bacterium]
MHARAQLRRTLISAGGLVLAAILFLAFNIVANALLGVARIDLTAEKLYTLSAGTRSVLAKIDEPITLRFYFSDRLGKEIPSYASYAVRLREMLREYQTVARGKLRLEIIDPPSFSDEEDRAVALGLQGVPVNQAGELVYFGLAGVNSSDKEEAIPFFQPERERFLEYDLTKLVFNLATPKKKAVGLLSSLPLQGEFRGPRMPPEPWTIYTQLQQFFEVRAIERDAKDIPQDIGVLVVVHPKDLPERTLYAIDQFVLAGGHALVFVDPHAEGELGRPGPAAQTGYTASQLKKLFDAWGVELVEGKLAGDRASARRVNAGTETRIRAVDYVLWLALRDANLNRSDVLMAETGLIQMASAGILKPKDGATTTITPLIQTSPQSMQIEAESVKMSPDPVRLLAEFKPENGSFMLAARIRGDVKSAFPGGPPADPKPAEGEPKSEGAPGTAAALPAPGAHLAQSRAPVNIIVVADTDLLEDRFWVQVQDFFGQKLLVPTAANGDFVINAVDNLSGSDDLISLRSRGGSARPFTRVQAIQRDAELRYRAKERELTDKLKDTEKKLNEIQIQDQGVAKAILSKAQQEAIDQFRHEMVAIRKELRDVQRDLRKDIDGLETWLKFVNIGLIPIGIGVVAVGLELVRLRRRRPERQAAAERSARIEAR